MEITVLQTLVTEPVPRDTYAPWLDADTNKVRLYQDFVFRVTSKKHNLDIIIVVPKGYISDWSSIPRLMWWVYPPSYSEARRGAVGHDYVYSHLYWYFSKQIADDILAAFMAHDGANWFSQKVFRGSVGIGGKGGWTYKDDPDADEHWRIRHEFIPYDFGLDFVEEATSNTGL